jgi:hypothetical protein
VLRCEEKSIELMTSGILFRIPFTPSAMKVNAEAIGPVTEAAAVSRIPWAIVIAVLAKTFLAPSARTAKRIKQV